MSSYVCVSVGVCVGVCMCVYVCVCVCVWWGVGGGGGVGGAYLPDDKGWISKCLPVTFELASTTMFAHMFAR